MSENSSYTSTNTAGVGVLKASLASSNSPRPIGAVSAETNVLAHSVEELEVVLNVLADKLSPILGPSREEKEPGMDHPNVTDLSGRIASVRGRVQRLIRGTVQLTDRVEL